MALDLDVGPSPVAGEAPAGVHPRPRPRPRFPGPLRRVGFHLAVIAGFTLPAVALWWNAWTGGVATMVRCPCLDSGQQVWFIAWPAYAVSHGLGLFSTAWLWPPHGVNLLANASAPLMGLVLAPFTWLFGPVAATTLALTLAPGLSAWGCWLACRRFVTWQPACWVAGFLFGYSPFVIQSIAQGHGSTALLVLPPLMLIVFHEILVRQQHSVLWCGAALAVLVSLQFLISPEILTITLVLAVVGVVFAGVLAPRRAAAGFPFAIRAFGVAAIVTMALLAFPVWYMLAGPQRIKGPVWSGLQTLFVGSAYQLWSAGNYRAALSAGALQGPPEEYIGFGVLAVAALSVVVAWRRRAMWVMALLAVAATVLSWGGILWLSPSHADVTRWLPWSWLTNRPVFDNVNAVHFAALADLAVALVVAIGLDALRWSRVGRRLPSSGRVLIVGVLTAAMVLPIWLTYEFPLAVQGTDLPPWYATAARQVPEGSVIVSYPFPASASVTSQPMVWQAADGMRFRLAGGYAKVPSPGEGVIGTGPPGSATATLDALTLASGAAGQNFALTTRQIVTLRSALHSWETSYIVVTNRGAAPTEAAAVFTAATGSAPSVSHQAWVWDLRAHPLRAPYDAASAATAFAACQVPTTPAGTIPTGTPLPQSLNLCVAAGIRA